MQHLAAGELRRGNRQLRPIGLEAALAGLGVGFWRDRSELDARLGEPTTFEPTMSREERERRYADWQRAVERSRSWAESRAGGDGGA